jgi:hypothetical protein
MHYVVAVGVSHSKNMAILMNRPDTVTDRYLLA